MLDTDDRSCEEIVSEAVAAETMDDMMDDFDLPVRRDKKMTINDLVELGKTKGKLTTQEIMDVTMDFAFDPEQIEKLYPTL